MTADQVRTFTVTDEDDGIRLDRWFRRNLPEASFGTVARWARTGQLRLDGRRAAPGDRIEAGQTIRVPPLDEQPAGPQPPKPPPLEDRKSTRLNSSHSQISYAVFCLKKK